jgi:8-oxo-dGTP pyrophosphatase MutT (NUDIX family)
MPREIAVSLQSGVLPFRIDKRGRIRVLLVTTGPRGRWGIPKGTAEPELTLRQNAAKEAFEEAGISGTVAPYAAGSFRTTKRRGLAERFIEVWVYLLQVEDVAKEWPEKARRRTKWMKPEEAAEVLREPLLTRLCLELKQSMRS